MHVVSFVGWLGKHPSRNPPRNIRSWTFQEFSLPNGAVWVHSPQGVLEGRPSPREVFWSGRPFGNIEVLDAESPSATLSEIDGKFSTFAVHNNQLVLATDIISAGPLYYRVYDDTLYFSDHLGLLLQIAAGPIQPNPVGIAAMCVAKFQVMEESHVADFYRLGAGQYIKAEYDPRKRKLSTSKSTYLDPAEAFLSGTPEINSFADYNDLLSASLQRENYDADAALMLSGGNDSQAIALALNRPGLNAITYGAPLSDDLFWAKQFAKSAKLNHHIVPYSDWTYATEEDLIVDIQGGTQGLNTTQNVVGFDWAQGKFSTAIVGFLGDLIGGDKKSLLERPIDEMYRIKFAQNVDYWDVDFHSLIPDELAILDDWIAQEVNRWSDLPPVQRLRLRNLTRRQPNWISTLFTSCSWFLPVSYPFIYRPLIGGMLKLGTEEITDQKFYKDWLELKRQEQGIRYRKDGLKYSLAALPSRLLKGTWPPDRVFWDDVTRRSQSWLSQQQPVGIPIIDEITAASINTKAANSDNNFPTFSFSLPIKAVFEKYGRS